MSDDEIEPMVGPEAKRIPDEIIEEAFEKESLWEGTLGILVVYIPVIVILFIVGNILKRFA